MSIVDENIIGDHKCEEKQLVRCQIVYFSLSIYTL